MAIENINRKALRYMERFPVVNEKYKAANKKNNDSTSVGIYSLKDQWSGKKVIINPA